MHTIYSMNQLDATYLNTSDILLMARKTFVYILLGCSKFVVFEVIIDYILTSKCDVYVFVQIPWCGCLNFLGIIFGTDSFTVFRDHPGEPVPEENFWTLWCKGRLTEANTLTIRLGATPSRPTSAHLHHPPHFLQAGCPSCRPTNSVKALSYQVT